MSSLSTRPTLSSGRSDASRIAFGKRPPIVTVRGPSCAYRVAEPAGRDPGSVVLASWRGCDGGLLSRDLVLLCKFMLVSARLALRTIQTLQGSFEARCARRVMRGFIGRSAKGTLRRVLPRIGIPHRHVTARAPRREAAPPSRTRGC